ncbi:adenylosuccinate synthase [Candidatus Woesearchaeota archaeon]|nr:adenylosuccinate synthase [Candidatus Woesearchaeota archaeon]
MTKRIAVLGAQWGDEGKGAIIAQLAENADIVVRAQGGDNAGHTFYTKEGKKVVTNIAPSGICFPNVSNVIGNGCVVNLETLAKNIADYSPELYISDAAHLILDYHRVLDRVREKSRNKGAIGTTQRGIGPVYADKMNRVGIRMGLLKHLERLEQEIRYAVEQKNKEFISYGIEEFIDADKLLEQMRPLFKQFAPCVIDTGVYLHHAVKENKRMLFEGSQAAMLDIDHGTYPAVTSSNTTMGGMLMGTGLGLRAIERGIGVAKAYTTRVGEGIFPTEGEPYQNIKGYKRGEFILTDTEKRDLREGGLSDAIIFRYIREIADEYGATTGRPRRVGWFDMVALKKAVRVNDLDSLAITKLDCLDGIGTLKVCTAYQHSETGQMITDFPSDQQELEGFIPVYELFKGWGSTKGIRDYEQLPKETKKYLGFIAETLNVPISLIKNGCGLEDYILMDGLW